MSRPVLSFVVPVRNDARRLGHCLESIHLAHQPGPIQIIVADNGSTDESKRVAEAQGAITIDLPDRRVSEVRNEATRHVEADLIAFVDADHTIGPGWMLAALACLTDPRICAVGADYHAPPGGTWVQQTYDLLRRRAPEPRSTDWLGSGNLVVRRASFEQAGGFDTSLESCEDVDLCRKLRATGGRLVATDAMYSVHHGDPRSLRALFAAELWRGRDNLRVSLRERPTMRSALALALTMVHLAAIIVLAVGIVMGPFLAWTPAAAAVAVIGLLTVLRAGRLLKRADRVRPIGIVRALIVAVIYDTARALALVARAGHGLRRKYDR